MTDPATLRADLERQGFRLSLVPAGLQVEPASKLTPDARASIRANKAALSELIGREAEIRALLAREMRGAGADHPDYPKALAIALRDPRAALEALRGPEFQAGTTARGIE